MVNAAELQALHQQAQQKAANDAPLVDPFPALREADPFPAPKPQNVIGTSTSTVVTNGTANGHSVSSTTRTTSTAQQPDFDSQSSFPSLGASAPSAKGQWAQKPAAVGSASNWSANAPVIQRTYHQESLSIPSSEETSAKLGQIIQRVQNKHKDVKVQASTTRKLTTFVVKGTNEASVRAAKRELTVGLARNVSLSLTIPASLRAFVIGQKGKNLKNITDQTGVRINIPKSDNETATPASRPAADFDYDTDEQIQVTIDGDEVNARQAKDMLSAIVAERTSRTTQRLTHIDHVFYPFIAGPKNANIAKLEEHGEVSVKVPPRAAFLPPREADTESTEPKRERDLSIIISGDRDVVAKVVQVIEAQVDEMRQLFRTLQISIPKRQHRFLVGDAAQDILSSTGCSIELAPIDDPSDSVTIRGPQGQLPLALTAAMEKANAVRVEVVDVGAAHRDVEHAKTLLRWLGMSGKLPREQNVQVYLPRSAIVESSGLAHIEVVGADANAVTRIRGELDTLVKNVPPSFVASVDIDPLLHRFIIGKKGAGLSQYSKKGVDVIFPPVIDASVSDGRSDVVIVLGDANVINGLPKDKKSRDTAAASILSQVKADIEAAGKQAADFKTETLSIPAKYHRTILGPGGTTLNAILGEERLAAVKFGSSASTTGKTSSKEEDAVIIRGPSSEVERVIKAIQTIAKEAEEDAVVNGHTIELTIDSQFVPHIVGRGGSGVTKLREDLGVKIDFGDANGANGSTAVKKATKVPVVIVGRKENAEEAKKRILSLVDKLADEATVTINVPASLHGSIIGQGGKYVTRLQDNYGVRINFPSQSASDDAKSDRPQKPDEVVIKGGKKGVEGAKAELLDLIEYEKENNNVINVPVSTKSIARIMGKGGANVNRIRDETGAQIDVDREDASGTASDTTNIRLRGTKKAIAEAKTAILAVAADVDSESSFAVSIPSRFHAQLIGPGGQNLRDIITRAGGDAESKSATQLIQFPRRGASADQADTVTVRGPAALAAKVKEELERIAGELQSRIVIGVSVPVGQHRSLMGRIRELQAAHPSTRIIVPGWREYDQLEISNAAELSSSSPESIVKIQGSKTACDSVKQEIRESFIANSQAIKISRPIAAKLASGSIIRRLRNEYGVSVDAPKVNVGNESETASKPPAGTAARIDDDVEEDDVDSLPFELSKIDLAASKDQVTWTLSSRSAVSLQDAVHDLESEVKRMQTFTSQARLWVDQRAIPRIVGRGGAGLREIEAQTEASIEIPRDQGGLVIIMGTEESVEDARQSIARIALQGGRNRD
ncbi:hypothetical protein L7F22_052824 [Adiantum nelumboides]|nr:hypothetical protein [Adiantum nelumboides]